MTLLLYPPRARSDHAHWFIRGRHRGKLIEKSTGCSTKEDAELWLADFLARTERWTRPGGVPMPSELHGRAPKDYIAAYYLWQGLYEFHMWLKRIDPDKVRRGCGTCIGEMGPIYGHMEEIEHYFDKIRKGLDL
jgi:hypothetical protein